MTGVADRIGHRTRGRGALTVVTVFLVGAGLLRIGVGAGHALGGPDEPVSEPASCAAEAGTGPLLAALRAREERVTEVELGLAERQRTLEVAKNAIDAKLAELSEAEARLSATIAQVDGAAEKDIVRLVAVYENMKPKEAAPLFEEMDTDFAAGFLSRMRPDAAAAILSGLDPKTAYSISAVLAGRNARAPKG